MTILRRTFVCVGPEPGVCSVDDDGCGYCIGVPCKQPKTGKQTPTDGTTTDDRGTPARDRH